MKKIGGFLELEILKGNNLFHKDAYPLSTGRACINFILKRIKPNKLFIPYYTCDAIFEPILLNKIDFEYYPLNQNLEPADIQLKKNEYLFFINYFGIKRQVVHSLINKYGKKLIIDDTQGFFEKGYTGIWSFNSARKFFGVPDGAYLYSPQSFDDDFPRNNSTKYDHLIQRLIGNQEIAYQNFLESEKILNSDILKISLFSEKLLSRINYKKVADIRIENFNYLHQNLRDFNKFKIPKNLISVPLCYPFIPIKKIAKSTLHQKGLFIPSFWDRTISVLNKGFEFEKKLADNLLPLPVDQRYSIKEMRIVKNIIKNE